MKPFKFGTANTTGNGTWHTGCTHINCGSRRRFLGSMAALGASALPVSRAFAQAPAVITPA